MRIGDYQQQVDKWIKEYGVRYFSELTNMVILTEEVGELAKLMARQYGEQSFKNQDDQQKAPSNIKDEIGDIIFVITCLANQMEIDIESVLTKNLEKKTNRDKERHLNNPKLK